MEFVGTREEKHTTNLEFCNAENMGSKTSDEDFKNQAFDLEAVNYL